MSFDPIAARHRKLEELFDAVLKLDASEREAFLVKVCASDTVLRSELEVLIDAHERTGSFLNAPAHKLTAAMIEKEDPRLSGKVSGHYQIDRLIGRGGMGEVYLARDAKLNRPVAIKFLSSGRVSDSARRRFQHEARMASALNHPHILTVHEAG